jgi:hypothetical protein
MGFDMGTLIEDARSSAEWMAKALKSSGYNADFTINSLKEVDRFFDEHSKNGQPIAKGLLSQQLGSRLFAIGSYVGEVIRRAVGGSWRGNDADPKGEINIELVLPNGTVIWPVQRVMKRFKNGREDEIYVYGVVSTAETRPASPH